MSTVLLNSLNVSKSTNNTTTTQVSGLTTLNGGIDNVVTTITLTSSAQYVTAGTIKIDNEYITYTGVSGNDLTGCVRGAFLSTAASHSNGANVYGVFVGIGDLNPQPNVGCSMSSDTAGTLYFQYSNDGVTYGQFPSNGFNVTANITEFQTGIKLLRYFRIIFINSSVNKTTTFQAATFYGSFGQPQIPLNQNISDDYTSIITRSVLTAQDPSNTFTNAKNMGYGFQTTQVLTSGATFTSAILSSSGYSQVQTELFSDQNGTINGYWYSDSAGTNLIRTLTLPYVATSGYVYLSAPVFAPYIKYSFTNTGGSTQTDFYYATKFLTSAISGQVLNLTDNIASNMVANLGRNVIVGETDGGQFVNVPVTNEGHLEVAIHGPINAFGSIHAENQTPISQSQGVYTYGSNTINPLIYNIFTTSSGTITSVNNMITSTTGTTTGSISQATSRQIVSYSPGQGLTTRFTGLFTSGVANTTQQVGLTNGQDLIAFGYSGTTFGIFYNSFGTLPTWTITLSGLTSPISLTINLNSVAYTISALSVASLQDAASQIAIINNYLGWTVIPSGATIIFQYCLPITTSTVTVTGTTGITGTPVNTIVGVVSTNVFIPQSTWNQDTCDGTGRSGFNLNKQTGNVFQIDVQYLGFGTFVFSVEASFSNNNSSFIIVHSINNPNLLTKPTLSIPSFTFLCSANNGTTTSNIVTQSASFGLFIEGQVKYYGNRFTHSRTVATVTTTLVPVYSIYNNVLFNGKTNKKTIQVTDIQFCLRNQNNAATLYIYKNARLVAANFSAYNSTYSCALIDTAATSFFGTTPTNEKLIISFLLADSNNLNQVLNDIYILPGEVLTIAGNTTGGTATIFAFSLNVREND